MTCRHCERPIVTVTIGGVTVWTHDRAELPPCYGTYGPRMCGGGMTTMATPGEA